MKRLFKWLGFAALALFALFAVAVVYSAFGPQPSLGTITVNGKSIEVFGKAERSSQTVNGRNVLMVFDKTEVKLENDVLTINGKVIPLPSFQRLEVYIKRDGDPQLKIVELQK